MVRHGGRHGGRHGAGDDADAGTGSFRWEPVAEEAAPNDPRRRRRVRALLAICGVGVVAIAVIAVVAVRVVVHEVDNRVPPLRDRIHDSYQQQFRACLRTGGSPGDCAQRTRVRCLADAGWPETATVVERDRACRFGPTTSN